MSTDPRVPNSGWTAALAFPGAARQINRRTTNTSHATYPEKPGEPPIYADEMRTIRYRADLALDLTAQLPAAIDSDGFAGPNGIAGDFMSLMTVSGQRMNPMSVPLTDNSVIADDLDLVKEFKTPRHTAIFDSLFDLMFRTVQPAPMSIRKSASSGLPHGLTDIRLKKELLIRVCRNAREMAGMIRDNKVTEMFDKFQVLNGAIMGVREQPDTVQSVNGRFVSKGRPVNDALYALTGGESGRRFDADKSVYIDGTLVENAFAMRRRSVYAAPGWLNYFFTAIFSPLRSHYFTQYEFTWKHRSASEIEYKAQRYQYVVGTDVKQFDQSVRRWILDRWVTRMSEVIDGDAITLLNALLFAPFCQPDPAVHKTEKGDTEPLFFGDPLDSSTWDLCPGLPSGVAPNPDLGKFIMVFTYLCLLDDKYHDVLEFGIDGILRGRHPTYAMLNMGDDNVFLTNDVTFRDWALKRVEDENYYVKIGPEEGVAFLGNVFYRDLDGQIRVRPDGVSLVMNWEVPERGLPRASTEPGRAARSFHAIGYFARLDHYQTAPSYGLIRDIWDQHHRGAFGESLDARELYWREHTKIPDFSAMSEADKLYIMNPATIYYRLSEDDVTSTLLNEDRASFPFENYFPLIKQYYL